MPTFSIPNVRLAGVSVAVPPLKVFPASDLPLNKKQREVVCHANLLAVSRVADEEKTQVDFCVQAAKQLLSDLKWDVAEVKVIVMATLTPDYPIPASSFVIHEMLGAEKSCVVFDILAGSIGLLQGMQSVASMLSNGHLKKGLLFTGGVPKLRQPDELHFDCTALEQILGDSGAALAFEYDPSAEPIHFDFGGDGHEFKSLALLNGASRNPINEEMLKDKSVGGPLAFRMDGANLFQFSTTQIPASLKRVAAHAGKELSEIDVTFVAPQGAGSEDRIRRELGISRDRFRSLVSEFRIGGSGAIPAAMIAEEATRLRNGKVDLLMAAFDAGLSWGSAQITTDRLVCSEIIEF